MSDMSQFHSRSINDCVTRIASNNLEYDSLDFASSSPSAPSIIIKIAYLSVTNLLISFLYNSVVCTLSLNIHNF